MSDVSGNAPRGHFSRWPRRGEDNRLEPECWPTLTPSFQLERGARVFTIGSCFARHVELHLARMAFKVPALEFLEQNAERLGDVGSEILNKYTPPSIFQELAWTKAILDRGGVVTADDIEPSLLRMRSGKFIDLDRQFLSEFGLDPDLALEQRQSFFSLFSQAFDCDVIVMTLGHIECWWDNHTHRYVEFSPSLVRENRANRFEFKRLNFQQAYGYIKDSIALLNSTGDKKILITTSPVPIARTFSGEDVIIANTYSKSVLRAVAGQVAAECPGVDYFPSFENVTLTKQPYVWEDDLVHVETNFVGKVMLKVLENYVPGYSHSADGQETATALKLISLCQQAKLDDAWAIYSVAGGEIANDSTEFQLAAANLCFHFNDITMARRHLDRALALAMEDGEVGWYALWPIATLYEKMEANAEADAVWASLLARCRKRPVLCKWLIRQMADGGITSDLARIRTFLEEEIDPDLELLLLVASLHEREHYFPEAGRLYRRALDREPLNVDIGLRLGTVLEAQGRHADAIAVLEGAMGATTDDPRALNMLRRLFRATDDQRGSQVTLRRIVQIQPKDYQAHVALARSLLGDGQLDEAEQVARAADDLDPSKPIGKNLLTRIAAARRALERVGATESR